MRISAQLGREISIREIFMNPSIATLAKALQDFSPGADRVSNHSYYPSFYRRRKYSNYSSHVSVRIPRLEQLIERGTIAPLDAAAITYLPSSWIAHRRLSNGDLLSHFPQHKPMLTNIYESSVGRIGVFVIGMFDNELYRNQEETVAYVTEAVLCAQTFGARAIALTGLIPSATDYGIKVAEITSKQNRIAVTTGHAATASAMILTISQALHISGRDLQREKVCFLGLGSIGLSTLKLMLSCLPHPKVLTLCDVYHKGDAIEKLRGQLHSEFGYKGQINVLQSGVEVPREVYRASIIIGATNVPDLLDVARLEGGTIVVDDSHPHCFPVGAALRRLRGSQDVLFTEGGLLRSPQVISETRYWSRWLASMVRPREATERDPAEIMGCMISAGLCSSQVGLDASIGPVDLETCMLYYRAIDRIGFSAAQLQCHGYIIPQRITVEFRRRFGHHQS